MGILLFLCGLFCFLLLLPQDKKAGGRRSAKYTGIQRNWSCRERDVLVTEIFPLHMM